MKHHPTAGLLAHSKFILAFIFSLAAVFAHTSTSLAQTPGLIFKKATTTVLDPNSDGYSSVSPTGFVSNDQVESEIPYRPLVVPSVEPVADPGPGPDCGFTDIVDSGAEDPVFSYVDGAENFLFRFRIGRSADNSKGYSVMLDTDQKFGFSGIDADPDAVVGNPGFEIEIVLESNFGVSLYDVRGTTSPAKKGTTLPWDSHAQKSVALTTNCSDADYFYDFYIPWSTITSHFPGVTQSTPIRMVAVTSMNPHPAIGNGAVSDVGGIDDKAAGYNYDQIFQTVIDNYTPTPATGTPVDRTACPTVNANINNGATTITGTSTAIGATIYVYKGTTTLTQINTSAVTVQANGTWTATVTAVATGEVISAKAQATGKGLSTNACSQITVTNCSPPSPPYGLVIGSARKLIEGTGIAGGTLNVYTLSAGNYVSAGNPISIPTGGSWCWRMNNTGTSNCSTSGASDLAITTYYVSQTVNGCESAKVPVCSDNSNSISTNPTLSQTSVSTSSTTVSGTSGSNATISIYANSTLLTTTTASGTSWSTTVNLSSHGGKYLWISAIESGKCAAPALSQPLLITVPTPVSATPVVTGSYCATASGTFQTVTGTSTEADGAVITVYINGVSAGTTTVFNGTWAKALTLSPNNKIRATATAPGETVSALSNEITVGSGGTAPTVSFNALVEGATTVGGTFSGGTTLKIYVDGALLASTTSSPFNIAVGPYDIYAGASVTATVTSGGCESAHSAAVAVPCLAPSTAVAITPATSDVCSGSGASVTLANPQENIIYQLYNGSTATGASKLGPASGTLVLTSGALSANTTLSVRALKISAVSCTSTLTATHAVTITAPITSNTITAPATSTFCLAGDPDAIVGSDPSGGNGTYSYQWTSSTDNVTYTDIDGATERDYNPGAINATTYYKRVVTSGPCQTVTSSAAVLTIQNTTLTNTISSSVSTNLTDSGTPAMTGNNAGAGITYVWQSTTDNITWVNTGVTSQNYTPGTTIAHTTHFRRMATNGACSVISNVITYTVNHTPTVSNFTKNGTEDIEVSFTAADFTAVFTDADDHTLTQIRLESISPNGVLHTGGAALSAGSVITVADLANLTFTPASNFNGSTTFSWKGYDGSVYSGNTSTVTVVLTALNDPPSAANKTITTNEDVAYTFTASDYSASYTDPEGATFAGIKITSLPAAGGLKLSNVDVTLNQVIPAANISNLAFHPAAHAFGTSYTSFSFQVSDGTDYSGDYTVTVDVTPVNDAPSFTKGADQAVSEEAGAQTVNGWATAISAGPANESAQTLTFNVSNDNNSLFAVQPAVSPTGVLTYTPAANAVGAATVTISLSDDGGGSNTSATQTFIITVNAVNDTPSFTKGADQTVQEDAGAQTVNGWATAISAGPANESTQTLTFTVSNNNNSLFSAQPAVSPTGVLTYTPAANAAGTATVTVSLSDNGGGSNTSATQTFIITVNAVNDTPSFTKGADQTVQEDAGAQTVNGWATAISAGPANESTQTLIFNVSNDNNSLFAVQPAVSPTGVLTYTPATNAVGTATVTVSLSDNGGGSNTSATQTFVITVEGVNDTPSFTKGADQTVHEDAGAQVVSGWATAIATGPANESSQTVSFNVSNDNNSLFAVQPAVSPTGVLTYTPADDAFGTANVTLSISDNGSGSNTSATQTFAITINPVNDAPSFAAGSGQTHLVNAGAITVATWATSISPGPANEASQAVSFNVSNDNNGLFSVQPSISSTGTLTYTLANAAVGMATVSVSLSDNGGTANGGIDTSPVQTFTITVSTSPNTPPTAAGKTITVNEDDLYTFARADFNASYNDTEGSAFAGIRITSLPANGELKLNGTDVTVNEVIAESDIGSLTFAPDANDNGTGYASFNFQVSDGTNYSASYAIAIDVTAINDAPSFTKGANQTVNEDAGAQTVNGWATAIAAGPANESSQTVSFHVSNDNNGLFAVQPAVSAAGYLTYTPAANAFGTATVTVSISDDGDGSNTSPTQTFAITINPVNDTPSFTKGANQTVNEDAGAQTVNGWATAIVAGPANESSQTVSFNVSNDNNSLFAVQPTISPSGTLTYTPAADAFGVATVTVSISDNGGGSNTSATQTFTITVNPINDTPSFTKGADQTVHEDAGAQTVTGWATAIVAGPASESTQTISFNVSNDNNSLFAVQPAVSATGVLTYTPAANAFGTATVTVSISDSGGGSNTSATQTFTITINPVNDTPSFTKGADQTVNEDAGAQTVTGWATAITTGPANESAQTVSFHVSNDNNSLFAVQPAISPNGDLTYTPSADAFGTATVTVSISDNGGGSNTSATETFTITINPVNDTPSFTKGADQTVNEDAGAQTVTGWATAIVAGPANESAQTVSFNVSNDNNSLFIVQPVISATGDLTYTPAADVSGTATVTVSISDSGGGSNTSATQTFTITINPVNDTPSFTKGADQIVHEDAGAQTVTGWATAITAGPANESSQTVSFHVSNDNNSLFAVQPAISPGGDLTYTPAADAFGTATVTVSISDSGGGNNTSATQTFTITVNAVNDTPSFTKGADQRVNEDAGAQTVTGWAMAIVVGPANESSQTVSFNVSNDNNSLFAVQPAINAAGDLTYTPAADAFGTATVTVSISDNGGGSNTSATQTFTITVNPFNDAPTAAGATITTNEDTPYVFTAQDFGASYADVEGTALAEVKITAVPANGVLKLNGVVVTAGLAIDIADVGALTFEPAENGNGTGYDSFSFQVSDGTDFSGDYTIMADVNAVNDAPSFVGGSDQTQLGSAGSVSISEWATSISAGPTDESGQALTFQVSNDNNGLFTAQPAIAADGTLTFTLAANASGVATVTAQLTDNDGTANGGVDTSAPYTFTITASTLPVGPTAKADTPNATEDTPLTFNVLANDASGTSPIDPASVDLDPSAEGMQSGVTTAEGTWNVVNGQLTFTPVLNFNGTASISYTVSDDDDRVSNVSTVTVTVGAVNDAPVVADKIVPIPANAAFSGSMIGDDDRDPDGSALVVSTTPVSDPTHGTIVIDANGTFTYTPDPGFVGTDIINVEICDTGLPLPAACVTRTITFRVGNSSNQGPIVADQSAELPENSPNGTPVLTVSATDPDDGDVLTYSITGNNGEGFFAIDPTTGVITIANSEGIDFETTLSFVLRITVTDNHGNSANSQITIVVVNTDNEDTDGDGISDAVEKAPNVNNPRDTDKDGIPDYKDEDSDNDGVPDSTETDTDTDQDGVADYRDTDDDNDGVSTSTEITHTDNDTDHDDDGIPDPLDPDDDNDGTLTKDEDGNDDGDFFNDDCDDDMVPDFIDAGQCKIRPAKGFSPDGDGQQDVWIIENIEQYPNNSVKVFNRWGNVIYEVKAYNNNDRAWSGQSDGKWMLAADVNVPDGTYFYAIDLGDGSKTIGGFIVLKR